MSQIEALCFAPRRERLSRQKKLVAVLLCYSLRLKCGGVVEVVVGRVLRCGRVARAASKREPGGLWIPGTQARRLELNAPARGGPTCLDLPLLDGNSGGSIS